MKLAVLLVLSGFAAAQAPQQPEQKPQDAPPKPRPALKLNLDEVDQARSRITFQPRDDKKPPAEATLPGMGGERSRGWEAPSDKVYPPDTNPNMR